MKKFVSGLIVGLSLSLTISYAASIPQNITVHYDRIKKIVVDGEDKTPTEKKLFIYEGTTYVPLRYFGEIMNKKITWDEKDETIYIGEIPSKVTIEKTYLTDSPISYFSNAHLFRINNSKEQTQNRDYDDSYSFFDDFAMSVLMDPITKKAERFDKGIALRAYKDGTTIVYNLNNSYDKLTGLVGYDNELNHKITEECLVRVSVDGVIKQEMTIKPNAFPNKIDLDIKDGKSVSIQLVVPGENTREPIINFVDMILEKHIIED